MPYGMGHGGWFCWPPRAHWMGFWHPGIHIPYWPPFYPMSREEEEAMLAEQAEMLEDELQQIKARLKELKKTKEEKKNEK